MKVAFMRSRSVTSPTSGCSALLLTGDLATEFYRFAMLGFSLAVVLSPNCALAAACITPGSDSPSGQPALSHPATGQIVSRFGLRSHPILQEHRQHFGIDYSRANGDPVFAAAAGEVIFAGVRDGYGLVIVIRHVGLHLETTYAHLSRIDVETGVCVQRQQSIGAIGSSGQTSSTHLHFEVSSATDPLPYLPPLAP